MSAQPDAGQLPASPGGPPGTEVAQALFTSTAQIGVALRESQEPVAQLGALFAHLVETLTALRSAPFEAGADPVPLKAVRGLLEQLQSDVFHGIQQLQFHDRMVQHMSRLQEYMISVANELDRERSDAATRASFDELRARLRERLISDQQRELLDMFAMAPTGTLVPAQDSQEDHSAPGSFELF
jgi:hypothetical protein